MEHLPSGITGPSVITPSISRHLATPGGLPLSRGGGAFFGPQRGLLRSVSVESASRLHGPDQGSPGGPGSTGVVTCRAQGSNTVPTPWHVRVWHLSWTLSPTSPCGSW